MTRTKIGFSETDYWLYSEEEGYDVSRGAPSESCRVIASNKGNLKLATSRSALVVIDMQNVFLHPSMKTHTAGLAVLPRIQDAVLASRKAGIKVIWVNWGLTSAEVASMPPGLAAGFTVPSDHLGQPRVFGQDIATEVDGHSAGKILMQDQWNTKLYGPLQPMWEAGEKDGTDVWIDKNRLGALNTMDTDLGKYLTSHDIKTLFFTGVNSDYCVLGTFNDAYAKGFDCVLLKDGCGTTTPGEAQQIVENVCGRHGFSMSAGEFCEGLEKKHQ